MAFAIPAPKAKARAPEPQLDPVPSSSAPAVDESERLENSETHADLPPGRSFFSVAGFAF